MDYLIGLDIGTSKLAAVAWELQQSRLLAVEQTPNVFARSAPVDSSEQDAEGLVTAAIALLRALTRRVELAQARPLALGVTGQMHGLVLVDSAGQTLSPLIDWRDGRGRHLCRLSGHSYIEEFAARLGPQALVASGCYPATGYGGITLLRLLEEKALPLNAQALTMQALLVQRLCGQARLDPSDAAAWGLFDVRQGARWIPDIAEALGLPAAGLLPQVMPTGSRAGDLLAQAARASGLPKGLPVAVALGDNLAAFIGSAPQLADTLLMNLGTGGQMSVPIGAFVRAAGLETRPLLPGSWLLVGASLCGGRAYEILKQFYQRIGQELFGAPAPSDLYEIMNRLADSAADDCGGLIVRPLFAGSRHNPSAKGSLEGLTASNLSPANLTRALIRGMVTELVEFYHQAVGIAGAQASWLVGAGNAVRNIAGVRQELERQLQMPLRLARSGEQAALGAALSGGIAAGVYADWDSASRSILNA